MKAAGVAVELLPWSRGPGDNTPHCSQQDQVTGDMETPNGVGVVVGPLGVGVRLPREVVVGEVDDLQDLVTGEVGDLDHPVGTVVVAVVAVAAGRGPYLVGEGVREDETTDGPRTGDHPQPLAKT